MARLPSALFSHLLRQLEDLLAVSQAPCDGAKNLAGGDTPDKLGPPLTLPGNLNIPPTVTRPDSSQYALVEVDGKATWFHIRSDEFVLGGDSANDPDDFPSHSEVKQAV